LADTEGDSAARTALAMGFWAGTCTETIACPMRIARVAVGRRELLPTRQAEFLLAQALHEALQVGPSPAGAPPLPAINSAHEPAHSPSRRLSLTGRQVPLHVCSGILQLGWGFGPKVTRSIV
jgi:hypothetical protein